MLHAQTAAGSAASGNGRTQDELSPNFGVNYAYSVCFTSGVFELSNTLLANQLKKHQSPPSHIKLLVFIDENLLLAWPAIPAKISAYCENYNLSLAAAPTCVLGGEAVKTQDQIAEMQKTMLHAGLDRHAYVLAIGGGAVLDAVGYAAATFHRGMRIVRLPTTVLAQNDAGIGVKNGINAHGIKNLLGCFSIPHAVINDYKLLSTLSERDFRAGFAEAVKVALIRDADFFRWLTQNQSNLKQREQHACKTLIYRCAELHLEQICNGGDPFESGSARPLDYGHWSAHKIEALTQHQLSHGESVAIGMALDTFYATEIGLISATKAESIMNLLLSLGFELWHPCLDWADNSGNNKVIHGLEEFRQHLGGDLCITLLTDIGQAFEAGEIDTASMLKARDKLRDFQQRAQAGSTQASPQ